MTIDIDPVIFHLGPLALSWYGVIVGIAIVAGVGLASREARRKGLLKDQVDSLALWVVVGGFVGARALHVIDRWGVRVMARKSAELRLVVPAEKGEFEFGCFVAGHYEAGMKGKLVIEAPAGSR